MADFAYEVAQLLSGISMDDLTHTETKIAKMLIDAGWLRVNVNEEYDERVLEATTRTLHHVKGK
jgi:hypothetical protein